MFSHALCSRIPGAPQPNLVVLSRSTQGCSETGGLLRSPPVWVRFPTSYLSSVPFFCRWLFLRTAVRCCRQQHLTSTSYCLFRKHALISSSEVFTFLNCYFVILFILRGLCCTRTPDSGEIRQAKRTCRSCVTSQLPD